MGVQESRGKREKYKSRRRLGERHKSKAEKETPRAKGPSTSETPATFWAPECQDEAVSTASATISTAWNQSPPQASPQTLWNHPLFHQRGSETPKGFSLSSSNSTYLHLGEEVPAFLPENYN